MARLVIFSPPPPLVLPHIYAPLVPVLGPLPGPARLANVGQAVGVREIPVEIKSGSGQHGMASPGASFPAILSLDLLPFAFGFIGNEPFPPAHLSPLLAVGAGCITMVFGQLADIRTHVGPYFFLPIDAELDTALIGPDLDVLGYAVELGGHINQPN